MCGAGREPASQGWPAYCDKGKEAETYDRQRLLLVLSRTPGDGAHRDHEVLRGFSPPGQAGS